MARRPRIDLPGYHHIVNRGVNRTDIFTDDFDKEKFLQIVCKACKVYGVIVHDYCLMCKKRTKPATHRVCIRPVKTLDIRPPMTVMIRPLLLKERDFIFA